MRVRGVEKWDEIGRLVVAERYDFGCVPRAVDGGTWPFKRM